MAEPAVKKAGWTRVAFGDVVRKVSDLVNPEESGLERYVAGEHMDTDDLRIRRWGVIGNGYFGPAFHMRFRPGQVLYGSRRTYLRKVAVPDFEGITANTTYVLEPQDPNVLLPELLPFIMQTEPFHEHSIEQSKGSVNPYLNFSDLARYEFDLPPMEQQRRIAEVLQASMAHAESLRGTASALGILRQSAIDDLAEKQAGHPANVGDVCSMQNGRSFPGKEYCSKGVRLLRPGNLHSSGYLDWQEDKTVHLPESWTDSASEFIIEPGDVLINLTAQSLEDGFMGRVCIARNEDRSLLNQRIGRLGAWAPSVLPEYVFRVLQSSRFQQHVIARCEGSKVKHLFWQHIARFPLRVPPTDRQREIIESLRAIDMLVQGIDERMLAALRFNKALFFSIL